MDTKTIQEELDSKEGELKILRVKNRKMETEKEMMEEQLVLKQTELDRINDCVTKQKNESATLKRKIRVLDNEALFSEQKIRK